MKRVLNLISKFPAALLLALIFSTGFGLPAGAAIAVGSMFVPGVQGVAMAGLNAEIWTDELMEGFYADDSFLAECEDLSIFVDYDKINLAEAGIDPAVLINNTTYPIATSSRTDTALVLELDTYDTENTQVTQLEKAELKYDKVKSIVSGHKNALRMKIMEKGAHAIAPTANGTFTPLLTTTGADDGNGFKAMKFKDILRLRRAFDDAEMPAEGRILVLTTQHESDLEAENLTMFNQLTTKGEIYGFKIYRLASKRMPRYNKTTGAKVAFGAAAAPSTDTVASFAFQKKEVARAMGTSKLFHGKAEDDPQNRKDVIGFQQRAMVIPKRNKGIAAIYSPAA